MVNINKDKFSVIFEWMLIFCNKISVQLSFYECKFLMRAYVLVPLQFYGNKKKKTRNIGFKLNSVEFIYI